jgi:hypothetical protein
MKQALTVIKSLVLRSPLHHSISSRKAFAKHSFLLLLAGTVLLFSSCKKELRDDNSPSSDLLSSYQKQNKPQKTVPFKANFTATPVVIQAPAPGTPLIILSTGTGEASHMGKTTFEARITIDVFGPQPNLSPATFTLTAANGDQIFMNSIGIVSPPDANGVTMVTLTNTITGGTGRFADAKGTLTGEVIRGATTDTISLEGWISY